MKFETDQEFEAHMEEYYGMQSWPEELKRQIHYVAWQNGHDSGYESIAEYYDDLVAVGKIALKYGINPEDTKTILTSN